MKRASIEFEDLVNYAVWREGTRSGLMRYGDQRVSLDPTYTERQRRELGGGTPPNARLARISMFCLKGISNGGNHPVPEFARDDLEVLHDLS